MKWTSHDSYLIDPQGRIIALFFNTELLQQAVREHNAKLNYLANSPWDSKDVWSDARLSASDALLGE